MQAAEQQILNYIETLDEKTRINFLDYHRTITEQFPDIKQWFSDGRNEQGKVISNPSIGYGQTILSYSDGTSREIFRIGISPTSSGTSFYFMGLKSKSYLKDIFETKLGKAKISSYCVSLKKLESEQSELIFNEIFQVLRHPEL